MVILESGLQNKPQKSTPPTHAQTSLFFITPSHSHRLSLWGNSSTVCPLELSAVSKYPLSVRSNMVATSHTWLLST